MPEGPFGFPRLTSLGPLVESDNSDDDILIVDNQFQLTKNKDLLYHVTEKEDLPSIIDEGLVGSKRSFQERKGGEEKGMGELMGPEDKFSPSVKAGRLLEETLNEAQNVVDSGMPHMDASDLPSREDSVFFFPTVSLASSRSEGLEEPIILSVKVDKIPCHSLDQSSAGCVSASLEIADELFEMFFNQAKEQAPVDRERERELSEKYWNTARLFVPSSQNTQREIFCQCDVPPDAIVEITRKVARLSGDVEPEDIF